MQEWFTVTMTLGGGVAMVVTIAIGIGTLVQRHKHPTEQRLSALEEWQKGVNEKLDADKRKLEKISGTLEDMAAFQRLALKSLKSIASMIDGQDAAAQAVTGEIDEYLMKR